MAQASLTQWSEEIREYADALQRLAGCCPHCRPNAGLDCVLCAPLWHLAKSLEAFGVLVGKPVEEVVK